MSVRPGIFLLVLCAALLTAAAVFLRLAAGPPDRLDELRSLLAPLRANLNPKTLIGICSLTGEDETLTYTANALVPVPSLPGRPDRDTVLFVLPAVGDFPAWDSLRSGRILLDSARGHFYRIYLSRRHE